MQACGQLLHWCGHCSDHHQSDPGRLQVPPSSQNEVSPHSLHTRIKPLMMMLLIPPKSLHTRENHLMMILLVPILRAPIYPPSSEVQVMSNCITSAHNAICFCALLCEGCCKVQSLGAPAGRDWMQRRGDAGCCRSRMVCLQMEPGL